MTGSVHIIPLGGDRCIIKGCGMTYEEIAAERLVHSDQLAKRSSRAGVAAQPTVDVRSTQGKSEPR